MKISSNNLSHLLWSLLVIAGFIAGKSLTFPNGGDFSGPEKQATGKSSIRDSMESTHSDRATQRIRKPRAASPESGDPVFGQLAFIQLLTDLTPGNIEAAFTCLEELAPDSMGWKYNASLLFRAWARQDPEAALDRAMELGGYGKTVAIDGALVGLAETDPEAARHWLEDNSSNTSHFIAVVEGIAHVDPVEATRFVSAMSPDGGGRGFLIEIIAAEQARRGIPTATAWATDLEDPELRETAFACVARQLAAAGGVEAGARWIQQHASAREASEAIEAVANTWAQEDPSAAARWLQSLPGEAGKASLAEVVGRWTVADPAEAAVFLNGLGDSPARSQAVYQFSVCLATQDPASACEWAATIGDPQLRTTAIRSALRKWIQTDPAAAANWKERNGV